MDYGLNIIIKWSDLIMIPETWMISLERTVLQNCNAVEGIAAFL